MLSILSVVLLTAIFAFAYRARGGAIPLGSTLEARLLFFTLPVTLVTAYIAYTIGAPIWLALISGAIGFGLITMGHGFAQNDDATSELEMGLVTFTRLAGILLPFAFFSHVIPFFALLGWLAWPLSRLSYLSPIADWTLNLFGILWCRTPAVGGSEWEEFFVGGVYGLTFGLILALAM